LWREAVQTAVEGGFAKSWMNEDQISHARDDVRGYLPG
jgi:hypothetical protein